MDNCLTFLGLIKKAGNLEIGEENVFSSVEEFKARCLFNASDASEGTKRSTSRLAEEFRIPYLVLPYTKLQLSEVIGRGAPAVIAITEIGFAYRFSELLCEQSADYQDFNNALALKKKRAEERKAARKEGTVARQFKAKRRSKQ